MRDKSKYASAGLPDMSDSAHTFCKPHAACFRFSKRIRCRFTLVAQMRRTIFLDKCSLDPTLLSRTRKRILRLLIIFHELSLSRILMCVRVCYWRDRPCSDANLKRNLPFWTGKAVNRSVSRTNLTLCLKNRGSLHVHWVPMLRLH